jgi:hypothetical protein
MFIEIYRNKKRRVIDILGRAKLFFRSTFI